MMPHRATLPPGGAQRQGSVFPQARLKDPFAFEPDDSANSGMVPMTRDPRPVLVDDTVEEGVASAACQLRIFVIRGRPVGMHKLDRVVARVTDDHGTFSAR